MVQKILRWGRVTKYLPYLRGLGALQSLYELVIPEGELQLRVDDFDGDLRMDVEGFELDVLAAATESLNLEPKPTWMVEILLRNGLIPGGINTRFHETFEMFWKRGYQCRRLDKRPTRVRNGEVDRWFSCGAADYTNFMFSST